MRADPSEFNGLVRAGAMVRRRDVAPGKVPCLIRGAARGEPPQEADLDALLVKAARKLARKEGYTLNQMLGRLLMGVAFGSSRGKTRRNG